MILPTDLPGEVAEHVAQPGFDAVLDRAAAARRRRRTTIASGLAAVVVVGGVVAATTFAPRGTVAPAPAPAPTPITGAVDERLPEAVRELLTDERIHPVAVLGSGNATAVVWTACSTTAGSCRSAIVTREDGEVEGRLLESGYGIPQSVPGGWLLPDGRDWTRITPAGETEQIYDVGGQPSPAEAGDTVVTTTTDLRLLRGDKLIPIASPEGSVPTGAYVAPDGRMVVAASGPGGQRQLATMGPGGSWRGSVNPDTTLGGADPVGTTVVTGHGDTVALAHLGDDPDGSIPVVDVQLSHDAGVSWTWVRGLDLEGADGLRNFSSLAVSPEGTTYLTTESHGLVRIDADGNAVTTPLSSHDTSAFALDDSVCVMVEAGRVDQLRCSADDGSYWTPMPLPGFR